MFDIELHVYPVVISLCLYICCLKHVVYICGVGKLLMFDVYSVRLA